MGNCVTPEDGDPNDPSAGPRMLPPVILPDFGKWRDDILDIVSRPIALLPAHTDVPRLCKKITVTDGETVLFDGSAEKYKDHTNIEVTKSLLEVVAKSLDDQVFLALLKDSYNETVVGAGDVGQKIAAWFAHVVKNCASVEPPTLIIFKTVHQRCIFPAFYYMRDFIEPEVGKFKDKRGTWSVRIDIARSVTIYHVKRQESVNLIADLKPEFEFDWELMLPLIAHQHTLDKDGLTIKLSNLACDASVDKKRSESLQKAITTHQNIK